MHAAGADTVLCHCSLTVLIVAYVYSAPRPAFLVFVMSVVSDFRYTCESFARYTNNFTTSSRPPFLEASIQSAACWTLCGWSKHVKRSRRHRWAADRTPWTGLRPRLKARLTLLPAPPCLFGILPTVRCALSAELAGGAPDASSCQL
ncbi:hypothetical protein B484DRAFT_457813 [Ochromonadaceae sp. CCMP2298]|nr:hypothetical protein B484DRAFT_457813 [Ochromonadaceae sp. CCMP2298]